MEVVDRPAASTDCQAMARSECRGQVGLGPSHRLDCVEPREQGGNGGGERAAGPVGVSSSYPQGRKLGDGLAIKQQVGTVLAHEMTTL
jgi:hypothetical protein